jgi:uncharacterized protein YndB with AHSA1/START domain
MTLTVSSAATVHAAGGGTGKVVIRRTIPAAVDELFDAWLDPESLAQWMRPGAVSHSTARVDARVGGAFEVVMHDVNGPLRHYGEYRAIERNRKLVFTWHSDATHDTETLVTVDFNVAHARAHARPRRRRQSHPGVDAGARVAGRLALHERWREHSSPHLNVDSLN